MWSAQGSSRSPPPLQHPIPTHPHFIPEPPDTPVTGGTAGDYMRFSSESSRPPMEAILNANARTQPQGQGQGQGQGSFHLQPNPQNAGSFRVPNNNAYGAYQQPANAYGQPAAGFGGMPWGVNDATAQIGMQLGRNAVQAGQDYVEKNFGSYLVPKTMLKAHFNVSNSYVLNKLLLLVFPWRNKGWNRRMVASQDANDASAGTVKYAPPREDLNSPDLYIPVMALVTYILLFALRAGLDARFHPEVIATRASTAITVIILETLFVKLGCYTLGVEGNSQFVDIVAYVGYKFVACTVLLLLRILHFGSSLYWAVFIYLFASNGFFLLRSLRALVLSSSSGPHAGTSASRSNVSLRSYRVMFLFSVAAIQIPGMWFLS